MVMIAALASIITRAMSRPLPPRATVYHQPPTTTTTAPHTSHSESDDDSEDDSESESEAIDVSLSLPALIHHFGYFGAARLTDGIRTITSTDQADVEQRLQYLLHQWHDHAVSADQLHQSLALDKSLHESFLYRNLELLPRGYTSLDSSRPWLVYWALQSLTLMGSAVPLSLAQRCVEFLRCCQCDSGGFGGGPQQLAHLAPTYATVLSLALCAYHHPTHTNEFFSIINLVTLRNFLLRMKQSDGSYSVCENGECDTRGVYTALVVASLTGLLSASHSALTSNTGQWLSDCQTYEGGMGGEPHNEAHGGYTFCGFAALCILGETHRVDLPSLLHWTVNRQHAMEGGLSGRTNKLVDGCYTFWVAALIPLIHYATQSQSPSLSAQPLVDSRAIQRYVLLACQAPSGGLRDKPGKGPDLYHTCYCLSGLSLAQELQANDLRGGGDGQRVVGGESSSLVRTNPIYNIPQPAVDRAFKHFSPFTESEH